MTTNRKHDKWQMLHFECHQPTKTTMSRTLNLAFLLGHPIEVFMLQQESRLLN